MSPGRDRNGSAHTGAILDTAEPSGSGAAGAPRAGRAGRGSSPSHYQPRCGRLQTGPPAASSPRSGKASPSLIISKAIPKAREQVPKRASLPRNPWHSPLGNYIIKKQKPQNFLLAESRKQMRKGWGGRGKTGPLAKNIVWGWTLCVARAPLMIAHSHKEHGLGRPSDTSLYGPASAGAKVGSRA